MEFIKRANYPEKQSGLVISMYVYFVLIIWWLTIFNKCIFDVANVGRSLAFIGRDGFYKIGAIFYRIR